MALAVTAYWLAVMTITRSEILAVLLTVGGAGIARAALNQLLFPVSVRIGDGVLDWLAGAGRSLPVPELMVASRSDGGAFSGLMASEAPYDLDGALQWLLPRAAPALAVSALVFGLAVAWVGRTRPDVRPWVVGERHPLRTFARLLNPIRQRHSPLLVLERPDWLLLATGALVAGLGLGFVGLRARHFVEEATALHAVQTTDPVAPTSVDLRPLHWRVDGGIEANGRIETVTRATLINEGAESHERLAFSLHRDVEVVEVRTVRGEARRVELERHEDRLLARLDPALGPGERLQLEVRVAGRPREVWFELRALAGSSFAVAYGSLHARFPRDLPPMALSRHLSPVSPRRVELAAAHLTPVPRFTPWTLTPPPAAVGDDGLEVPEESRMPIADLRLHLVPPRGMVLADSCGGFTAPGQGPLESRCALALDELSVLGGWRVVQRDGGVVVATLPAHRESGRRLLASAKRVLELSESAWPGLAGLDRLVALEWPSPFDPELLRFGMREDSELRGRLLVVPERRLVDAEPVPVLEHAASLLTASLLGRRPIAEDERFVLERLLEALMLRRMGVERRTSAVLDLPAWLLLSIRTPILEAPRWRMSAAWTQRLPALLVELEARIGAAEVHASVDAFLDGAGGGEGHIRDLFTLLEERTGVEVFQMYEDHFEGDALPELRLEEVGVRRSGDRFQVSGVVRNLGTGRPVCPVVVRTDVDQVSTEVAVPSGGAASFTIFTARPPHTALLDPDGRCLRLRSPGGTDRAELAVALR